VKLLRVLLRDYRGIAELELTPAPLGVTVVVGPNEVGKSSLPQALDLVFRFKHDSKHSEVLATKPVHADKGAYIEVELETGPYRFVYEKQYHRSPHAKLTVTKPAPENWTGREAHERAESILKDTLDVALFKALSVAQGEASKPLELGEQAWISRAFDRAAGASVAGKTEKSLFDHAQAECEPYYTSTGKEREPLTAKASAIAALEIEQRRLEADLQALENDLAETARLDEALKHGESALTTESEALRKLEGELLELERARSALSERQAAQRAAATDFERVEGAVTARAELVEQLRQARERLENVEARRSELAPELEAAADKRAAATRKRDELEARAQTARARAKAAADDDSLVRDENDLRLLRERRKSLEGLDEQLAAERAKLGGATLDDKRVEALRARATEVLVAETNAAAAAARVVLRAKQRLELTLDGEKRVLENGASLEALADKPRKLEVRELFALELRPGADAATLDQALAKRRAALRSALDELGVRDVAEAERKLAEQGQARAQIAASEARRKDLLVDLTPQSMLEKLARLEAAAAELRERRNSSDDLPESTLAARQRRSEAEALREDAQRQVDAVQAELRDAEKRANKLESEHRALAARIEAERGSFERAAAVLSAATANESDEALNARRAAARAALDAARWHAALAAEVLRRREPEALEARCSNKRAAVESLRKRLAEQSDRNQHVKGGLDARGQEGLAEKLDGVLRALALGRDDLARTRRRAEAAKLLFETLREERENERRTYVAPLKERIESLARIVYGPSLRITLGDNLAIESRTLGGVTVPFDSLSTGAKEQLGVLARLACAQIVTEDGGVPLILDDVLGHTDPERLERMCAVLALAGKRCQVLLFTSNPERYRGIGGAKFVELTRS
jgi:hypothetical protein